MATVIQNPHDVDSAPKDKDVSWIAVVIGVILVGSLALLVLDSTSLVRDMLSPTFSDIDNSQVNINQNDTTVPAPVQDKVEPIVPDPVTPSSRDTQYPRWWLYDVQTEPVVH